MHKYTFKLDWVKQMCNGVCTVAKLQAGFCQIPIVFIMKTQYATGMLILMPYFVSISQPTGS